MKPVIQFQRVKSLRKVKREKLSKFTEAAEAEAGCGDLDFRFFVRSRWISLDLVAGRGDGGARRAAAVPIQLRARQVKRLVRALFQVRVETCIATYTLHIK